MTSIADDLFAAGCACDQRLQRLGDALRGLNRLQQVDALNGRSTTFKSQRERQVMRSRHALLQAQRQFVGDGMHRQIEAGALGQRRIEAAPGVFGLRHPARDDLPPVDPLRQPVKLSSGSTKLSDQRRTREQRQLADVLDKEMPQLVRDRFTHRE